MKRIIIYLTIIIFSGHVIAQKNNRIDIGDFEKINTYAGIELNIIKAKENKIILSSRNKDNSIFIYKIKNGILKLKVGLDKKLRLGNIIVDLYYKNEIHGINLYQGSNAILEDTLNQTNLNVKVNEGSSFKGKINNKKLNIQISSGGEVLLSGKSSVSYIQANTGGVCFVEEVSTEQTTIKANTGSIVHANATVLIDAKASTGAIIRVHGNPIKTISKTALGGSIIKMK